jgi:hypothetical protein
MFQGLEIPLTMAFDKGHVSPRLLDTCVNLHINLMSKCSTVCYGCNLCVISFEVVTSAYLKLVTITEIYV